MELYAIVGTVVMYRAQVDAFCGILVGLARAAKPTAARLID
jgi:hypothetical protein